MVESGDIPEENRGKGHGQQFPDEPHRLAERVGNERVEHVDLDVAAALQGGRQRKEEHEDEHEDRDVQHPGDRVVQDKAVDDLHHDRRHDDEDEQAGHRRKGAIDQARERLEPVEPVPALPRLTPAVHELSVAIYFCSGMMTSANGLPSAPVNFSSSAQTGDMAFFISEISASVAR